MMKKTFLFISIVVLSISVPNHLNAQYKIGTVFRINDSLMTHSHIGFTIFENFKEEYKLPFNLKEFVQSEFDSVFSLYNNWFVMEEIDESMLNQYLDKKKSLKRKEFKTYAENYFEKELPSKGFDAMMLIETIDPNLVYGMNANKIETEDIAISTGRNKKTGVYIRMQVSLIYTAKPQKLKALDYGIITEGLPMVKKGERFTDLQLIEFEKVLEETITKQFLEIKKDPKLVTVMQTELRRRAIIRKQHDQN
jgi:hypothetical protein